MDLMSGPSTSLNRRDRAYLTPLMSTQGIAVRAICCDGHRCWNRAGITRAMPGRRADCICLCN
jgi:hypothetical protein